MKEKTKKTSVGDEPIYDARALGKARMFVLGFQHVFAMFGATVLVPTITGLSVSNTLLFAGLGTLLFHLLTKGKVPAFLGSSFAFLAAYGLVSANGSEIPISYSSFGVVCAGLVYVVVAALIKGFGAKRVLKFVPPIVTGPIIIAIGLSLSGWAFSSCADNWWIALIAVVTIIICNIWGRGMSKIIPILIGVIVSYGVAAICYGAGMGTLNPESVQAIIDAKWIGLPIVWEDTALYVFKDFDASTLVTAVITIVPLAIATIVEHIGDISAISSTTGINYIGDPGLHRTLLGDGLATSMAAVFGAPANTTYGENTGVLNLTKVYDPRVIRIAAVITIVLAFCPKFGALITAMPTATLGGVSLILYGMISAVGVRNVVENKVDFTKSRNVIIAALILVLSVGIKYGTAAEAIVFTIGGVTISLSGLAVAAITGIVLNAILPGKDYEFGMDIQGDTSVNFKV